jgi:RHS repeat-associated protein
VVLGGRLLTVAALFIALSVHLASPAFAATLLANAVVSVPPPTVQGAVSRKVHGGAGTFDLALSPNAATPTVEPRQGTTATIVFTFDKAVTGANAAVTEGVGTAGTPTISGNAVSVALTGVTNAQWVTVTLTDVASADGGSGGAAAVRIGFLVGDVSQNRVVTVSDLAQVNAQIAQVVGGGNFLRDVNASGTLTVADKGIANTQITKALPALGNAAPVVSAGADQAITLPATASLNGTASDDGLPSPPGAMSLSWTKVSGPGTVTFDSPASVATTASFDAAGTYVLRLTASDGSLVASDEVQVTISGTEPPPTIEAPPLNTTTATNVADATAFLYSGPNPVQTGVAPGTIVPQRAAVVRGKVLKADGSRLPGVTITILGRPEFGQTTSRSDGVFDLAVNGGGPLVVSYSTPGYLPIQRQVDVRWQDYTVAPDVVMTPLDARVTTIAANAATLQVHEGNPVTDGDGTRRAVLMFPAGTGAELVLPNGTTQPLASMNVRATEYTVGPNGPKAMPAPLPPTSAYTYAVELSVDEAIAAGASRVDFSQPVPMYVDNFLGFAVGTTVPTGYYDRARAVWVPAANGRVIRIAGVSGGLATVDSVGTGNLPALSLSDAERQRLADLYVVGQTLWRVPVSHFTPWDCNWPYVPPDDATAPGVPAAGPEDGVEHPLEVSCGSVIECQNQVLRQSVPIVGTPFQLHYSSARVPGRLDERTVQIPLSGPAVPASLKRIELQLQVAGRRFEQSFAPIANQRMSFVWDGKDAYGRPVQGRQVITGSIGYVYDGVYAQGSDFEGAFGKFGDAPLASNRTRSEITISQPIETETGAFAALNLGLGGWTLSPHHIYLPTRQRLELGDGTRRSAASLSSVVNTLAGGGTQGANEGLPATEASLGRTVGVAVGRDGTVYIAERTSNKVRRIGSDGILTTIAGTGLAAPNGDGPGLAVNISDPYALAVGPEGSIYVAEIGGRIRRLDPAPTAQDPHAVNVVTIAGTTSGSGFNGDNIPALQANLDVTTGIAVGADGSVYVADQVQNRVRRISPDGIITTLAGTGVAGYSGDGGSATLAQLNNPGGVAVGPDGSVYISDFLNWRLRGVRPDGTITTVAGNGDSSGFGDDGVPALQASIGPVQSAAVGPDGSLYIPDILSSRILRVGTDGIITTFAGTGDDDFNGEGLPPSRVNIDRVGGVAVGPDRRVYYADEFNFRVRVVRPALPGFSATDLAVASSDGAVLYQFDADGRHLRTLEARTAATLLQFTYDSARRLATVAEKTGGTDNVTTIQRNANGNPTAIVGPFGQVTSLGVDANGFLSAITSPAGETHAAVFDAGGLMQTFSKPGNRTSSYQHDAKGRLIRAEDAVGGFQTLTRAGIAHGHRIDRTTAMGRTTRHLVEQLATGDRVFTTIAPDGTTRRSEIGLDATEVVLTADGVASAVEQGGDPRFGMQSPFATGASIRLPSGLTLSASGSRTVALSDPGDVLSLSSLTATSAINGRTTTSTYAAATRTEVTTTPSGRTFTTVFDGRGRVASTQPGGLAAVGYAYDSRGRLASVTAGTGGQSRTYVFGYGAPGFLQSVTDPLGRTAQFVRDANGRATSKTLPGGAVVGFGYDAAGDRVSITPPGRPAHTFGYDGRGELTSVTPPVVGGSGSTTFAYDADRQLATFSQPGGESIAHGYDAAGRLSSLTLTNTGLPGSSLGMAYDGAGRLATITGPEGQGLEFKYDGSLVTGVLTTGGVSTNVSRSYDGAFRVASESVNGSSTIAFTYDADDLVIQAGGLAIGRSGQNGLVESMSLGVVSETLTRNVFGEVTGQTVQANGAPVYVATFTRDALGRIVQRQETVGGVTRTHAYSYDAVGQLTGVVRDGTPVESYAYDGNRNRVSATVAGVTRSATHDAQDRLLTDGSTAFTHTPAGRRATRTSGADSTAYRYDALGNLLQVTLPSGTLVDYQVDGINRRIAKGIGGVVTQRFAYAGSRVIAELDALGGVVSRFVYAEGLAPSYMVKGGESYRIVTDRNQSVRLVVNASTGVVEQRIDYDAFGNVTQDTNPGFQPFGFAGGLHDPDTDLVRFGARDYDPATGRWTAKDPLGFRGGDANLYAYARNDPIDRVDPGGTFAVPAIVAAAAVVIWANPIEVALTASDLYDFVDGLFDPEVSAGQSLLDAGLLAAGAALPLGGYGKLDDLCDAAKELIPAPKYEKIGDLAAETAQSFRERSLWEEYFRRLDDAYAQAMKWAGELKQVTGRGGSYNPVIPK